MDSGEERRGERATGWRRQAKSGGEGEIKKKRGGAASSGGGDGADIEEGGMPAPRRADVKG